MYPEIIDSVVIMAIREFGQPGESISDILDDLNKPLSDIIIQILTMLSTSELFDTALIDKEKKETEIFNYFLSVSFLQKRSICLINPISDPDFFY